MSLASLLRLFFLAAIWGASFLFMRMAANSLGPAVLIEFRVGFAALTLFIVALYLKRRLAFTAQTARFDLGRPNPLFPRHPLSDLVLEDWALY